MPRRFEAGASAARDVPGNKVDEDCSGKPAPFPRLESAVIASFLFEPFRVTKLTIDRTVAGSRIAVRCRGHVGFMRRYIVRGGSTEPRREDLCLPVGKGRPKSC